jgi:hypothetical protein
MPDFGIFRGFNEKLFGDKLYAGQLPTQLGLIGSENFGFQGLLDFYPNAAAAYSLRKLRAAYTGSAIKVRRASDNTEQDIGFVNNELDTSALTTFCSGTNGFVTTWYDQSGNANNATQTTAANQPQIVSSGSVILDNGKPSVEFDGINDFFDLTTSITTEDIQYSVIELIKRPNISASSVSFANIDQPYVNFIIGGKNTIYFARPLSGVNGKFQTGTNSNYNQQLLFSIDNKTSNLLTYSNGNLIINGLSTGALKTIYDFDKIGLRSTLYNKGPKQELIIYLSDQSSNRTGIETNINDFYSIY